MQEQNLVQQAEGWRQHSAPLSLKSLNALLQKEKKILTLERLNADELRTELQEAQADLTQWQEWYDQYDWPEEEEGDLVYTTQKEQQRKRQQQQQAAAAAAQVQEQPAAAGVVPITPVGPPTTLPVLLGQIPAHLMPPSTLPTFWYSSTRAIGKTHFQRDETSAAAAVNPDSCRDFFAYWGAPLPNPSTPAQTSQPNYGNATLNPPLGVATAVPAAPSGPWSFTRQAYKGVKRTHDGSRCQHYPY